ncbi:MAG TPA: SPOR domain-containing protein [Paenibacillus sp.]
MNKAKMTFRFDKQGKEIVSEEPLYQSWIHKDDRQIIHADMAQEGHGLEQDQDADRHVQAPAIRTSVDRNLEDQISAPHASGGYPAVGQANSEVSHKTDPEYDEYEDYGLDRTHGTYRTVETMMDYGDPFSEYTGAGGVVVSSSSVRPPKNSWWKMIGSVTGAIVTGALFGFVVLSIFNQEITLPIPGISVPKQSAAEQSTDVPVMGQIIEDDQGDSSQKELVNITLSAGTYYFLQYGVFSTTQGVELAQKELQSSGVAAARDTVDTKRVYAGVSVDREQAKLLSSQLKSAGVNLILHELSLPTSAMMEYEGDIKPLEQYMTQSAELVKLLSTFSAAKLSEIDPGSQGANEIAELSQKHQLWTESAAKVRGQISASSEVVTGTMEKAMNSAIEALSEYNKKPSKSLLWEVQNELMNFILSEQELLTS